MFDGAGDVATQPHFGIGKDYGECLNCRPLRAGGATIPRSWPRQEIDCPHTVIYDADGIGESSSEAKKSG